MQGATKETGSILDGKFRVIRPLGAGGMGAVYEVEHTLTKHRRALKLLNEQMAKLPSIVERFLREASAAGHIKNPHVIETFDAGTLASGEPYIVMELLSGQTLAALIERRGALGVAETCDLLIQACDGIGAAHAAGIVHRDLKPENLFLLGTSPAFVKILDFGISKFDPALTGAHSMTSEGSAMGTPYYMPPEQARGDKSLGTQADVYALGVVLYECLCGVKPFDAETLAHLAVLIAEGNYQPASQRRPGLPAECDAVIARAMAADRTARYASVVELADALRGLRARTDSASPLASVAPPALVADGDQNAKQAADAAFEATAPAAAPTAGAAAQTEAPLSRTASVSRATPRRVPWLAVGGALAVAVTALALLRANRDDGAVRDEPSVPSSVQPLAARTAPPSATAEAPSATAEAPPVTPKPILSRGLPSSASPAASARAAHAKGSASTPAAKADVAPKPASRAAGQGLYEDNPFR